MLQAGELEYVFPNNPEHPQQAYRAAATHGGNQ
jgi:hypothetical protein